MIRFVTKRGIGRGPQILNAETGEDLSGIVRVAFGATITIGETVTAKCELAMVDIDVTAAHTELLAAHPISKKLEPIASIAFRDGWCIQFLPDGTPRVSKTPTGEA
jgi:hypothetical protein